MQDDIFDQGRVELTPEQLEHMHQRKERHKKVASSFVGAYEGRCVEKLIQVAPRLFNKKMLARIPKPYTFVTIEPAYLESPTVAFHYERPNRPLHADPLALFPVLLQRFDRSTLYKRFSAFVKSADGYPSHCLILHRKGVPHGLAVHNCAQAARGESSSVLTVRIPNRENIYVQSFVSFLNAWTV